MTPEVEAAFKGLAAELRRGSERRRHTFLMGMHRRYESSGVLQPCVHVVHHMTHPFQSCLLWHVPAGYGTLSAALAHLLLAHLILRDSCCYLHRARHTGCGNSWLLVTATSEN